MATNTYIEIASTTLDTATAQVEFTSIPQDYRDLVLVTNSRNVSNTNVRFRLNNTSSTSYEFVGLGASTSIIEGFATEATEGRLSRSGTAGDFNVSYSNFLEYSVADKDTAVVSRFSYSNEATWGEVTNYIVSEAVTSLQVFADTGTFDADSTFTLYGVAG